MIALRRSSATRWPTTWPGWPGGSRGLLLALILAPWWINYLTRMLAWVGILGDEGYVNDILGFFGFAKVDWLGGQWYVVVARAGLRVPAVLHHSALRLRSTGSTSG